ncbi:MAG: hypothetical protein MI810_17570 [Flavobacteriales bacterium]|nr:hypothetical protein [Flavobacteriales bacterium]
MPELSILCWNIEHFNGGGGIDRKTKDIRKDRVSRVVEYIREDAPDIFALSEVEGNIVHHSLTRELPGYVFNITEGRQSQEILVGVKHGITAFFTQRNEFKRSNPNLRPGALLTVTMEDEDIPILFTHLKSMPSPEGFGLRDAMFGKAFNLKRALDKVAKRNGKTASNFIIIGDMNMMGMNYEGKMHDISGTSEIEAVAKRFKRRGMAHLAKNHTATFNNGSKSRYPPADLDHVFAAKHLNFKAVEGGGVVDVQGWAKIDSISKQDQWIYEYSDHAPLKLTLEL